MCGIIGFMTNNPKQGWTNRRDWYKQALFADTLRGFHSTGLMFLDQKERTLHTFKKAVPAYDMLDMKQFDKFMVDVDDYSLAVGHNRAATRGKINTKNAHPFMCENIIGVHNGTLTSMMNLDDDRDFDVDSECIFHNIQKNGSKETIEKLNGAFALVWHDVDEGTTHIIRNSERPLCYAVDEKTESIFFASEPGLLAWLCSRNSIKIGEIQWFDEMYEYVFTDGDILNFSKEKRQEHVAPKPYGGTTGYYQNGKWIPGGGTNRSSNAGRGAGQNLPATNETNVNRGKRKSQTILEQEGYELKEEIHFFLVDFIPYSYDDNSRGKGIGFTSDDNRFKPVMVHAMEWDQFEEAKDSECKAEVIGGCFAPDELVPKSTEKVFNVLVNADTMEVCDTAPWQQEQQAQKNQNQQPEQQQQENVVNFLTARGTTMH